MGKKHTRTRLPKPPRHSHQVEVTSPRVSKGTREEDRVPVEVSRASLMRATTQLQDCRNACSHPQSHEVGQSKHLQPRAPFTDGLMLSTLGFEDTDKDI